jgi:hypothetical protein
MYLVENCVKDGFLKKNILKKKKKCIEKLELEIKIKINSQVNVFIYRTCIYTIIN